VETGQTQTHLSDRDSRLYVQVLRRYLELGDPFRLKSVLLVEKLINACGVLHSHEIISDPSYPTKRAWLFDYFAVLPSEAITTGHLSQLCVLYREAERVEVPYSYDFLLRYKALDEDIVARATAILLEKVKKNADFASTLSGLFNPHTEVNKAITQLFANHLGLLKQAYFAMLTERDNEDHEGRTLARIMQLDPSFILEYIDYVYERKGRPSRYDDNRQYSFLWMRDDYEELMWQGAQRIFEQEQKRIILPNTYLQTFFFNHTEDEPEVSERQDGLLETFIEQQHNDADFMALIFDVIVQFPPERRRRFVSSFLDKNKAFEDFERLPLEPNSWGWSGSAVPMYQGRVEYFESLFALLNTVEFLDHKQYVERHIQYLRSQIEKEKRKDFLRE
jgi:hypothetical protein